MTKIDERNGLLLLALSAAAFVFFVFKGVLIAPPPIAAAHEFNAVRAYERLQTILGDETPHPVDTPANDAVRERLIDELRKIGYAPILRDEFTCSGRPDRHYVSCARVRNVIARIGPTTGGAIVVASHYDSVPAGPGAADDGAGIAAALEIAAILAKRPPAKPTLFLFTDGEEAGLIGAHSFVRNDPLARDIDAVINIEARGAAGPAILFETSAPNARDIAAYTRRARSPVGNSLATDIYKMMPNDTDATHFRELDIDVNNFAFMERQPLYHTPQDNLVNLDKKSLSHIGRSALASLDGYLRDVEHAPGASEGRVVFADLFSRHMIVLPQIAALVLILLGMASALVAFLKIPGERPWRAAAATPIALIGAGALSVLSLTLIDAARTETYYWSTTPLWTRAVIYLSAIAASCAALRVAKGADRARLAAASWAWFSLAGVVAYVVAPGSAILFALPLGLFTCAALASFGAGRLLIPGSLVAVVAALILLLPTLHHAEVGLGLGAAGLFAIPAALLFMLAAPAVGPVSPRVRYILAPAAALVATIVLAATAPAYSTAAPRPLNILHVVDAQSGKSVLTIAPAGQTPPPVMTTERRFDREKIAGLTGERYATPAAPHDRPPVVIALSHVESVNGRRTMRVQMQSRGADELVVMAPASAQLTKVIAAGETTTFTGEDETIIRCSGRSCATFAFDVEIGATAAEWTILSQWRGLDAEGADLASLRPSDATPIQGGDTRVTVFRVDI